MNKVILIVIVVILIVGGGIFLMMNDSGSNDIGQTGRNQQEGQAEMPGEEDPAAIITYTDNGFSLDSERVSSGSVVEIRNNSSSVLDLSSDSHPVHTDNVELNVGITPKGESRQFTLTEVGEWGFHNHIRPEHAGKITVSN